MLIYPDDAGICFFLWVLLEVGDEAADVTMFPLRVVEEEEVEKGEKDEEDEEEEEEEEECDGVSDEEGEVEGGGDCSQGELEGEGSLSLSEFDPLSCVNLETEHTMPLEKEPIDSGKKASLLAVDLGGRKSLTKRTQK